MIEEKKQEVANLENEIHLMEVALDSWADQ